MGVAVLVYGVAASLSPMVPDAIENAIDAQMSAWKVTAKILVLEVKADLLLSDQFDPELHSAGAAMNAGCWGFLSSIHMHIFHAPAPHSHPAGSSLFE